jgi:hypothetical protein
VRRSYAPNNPALKLGMKRAEVEHKTPWTLKQTEITLAAAEKRQVRLAARLHSDGSLSGCPLWSVSGAVELH